MKYIVTTFDPKEIEQKWKQKWIDEKIFEADPDKRKKLFVNFAFPYVNGPLHLGHSFTLTRLDTYARFKRMQGFNVLFPFAFHATGEPILGVAERLAKGDEIQKRILLSEGVSEKDLSKFKDPKYIVSYWKKRIIDDVNNIGASVDWRRKFSTIDPNFNRFIEWQYNLLKRKGYVVQGTHPVVWCPHCESPTGDHDRLEGEGESPIEFVIYKFRLSTGEILPTATLRPETIYGVTNIWIRPDIEYVKAKVDNETWIISESAVEKLKDQLYSVKILEKIKGEKFVGKFVKNPVLQNEVIVLPASFVDPDNATGIVMSVPSHAPYDWIALKDLSKIQDKLKSKYKIKSEDLKAIKPISVVKVESFGDHPAIEICEKMGIQDQSEKEKLDEATDIIYKKEFHQGILKENTGKYKGLPVAQCKKQLSEDFKKLGLASSMWELTGKVICRCGTKNHVKILEKQWFLKFSDEKWKRKARECLRKMKLYPEQARKQFEETINWLEDKACARKSGLGTRLPWDKEWIVETLSDSVIYIAFYTIAKYLNAEKIEPHQLKEEVFDFIFLGKGDAEKIAKETGISKQLLQKMREEFDYWYGFDMRASAKELIPNHFTFCIFHHVAVWDNPKYWPHAFTINGMQQINGKKMSKSKGNYITIQDAIDKYSADAVRVALMDGNEGMEDPDWTEQTTLVWRNKLNSFYSLVENNYDKGVKRKKEKIDLWLESRFQEHIKKITEHMERTENRSGLTGFYKMLNDFQWYLKRVDKANRETVNYALEVMTKVLSVFAPFICEEIWNKMKKKGFVSLANWPEFNEKLIDKEVLQLEEILVNTYEDIKEVIKLSKKNEKLYLYLSSPKELEYFKKSGKFLEKEFGFKKVDVFLASDPKRYDPENKAKRTKFEKPGIYIE